MTDIEPAGEFQLPNLELFEQNIGSGGITHSDLESIRVPTGGTVAWELEGLDGVDMVQEFQGLVLHSGKRRSLYNSAYDPSAEASPPDCSSQDGEIGVGLYGIDSINHPTGKCSSCPMDEWGSAPGGGRGKACRENGELYLIRDGELIPSVLRVPPTSLGVWRKLMLKLAGRGLSVHSAVFSFSLEKKAGGSGNFSVLKPGFVREASAEEVEVVDTYRSMMSGMFAPAPLETTTPSGGDEDDDTEWTE